MKLVAPNKLLESTREQLICFAHYGDGEFIGFHADTFGTISKHFPKIYTNTERQVQIIEQNYKSRINSLRLMLENGVQSVYGSESKLSKYKNLELKIVLCNELGKYPDEEQVNKWLEKEFKVIHTIKV